MVKLKEIFCMYFLLLSFFLFQMEGDVIFLVEDKKIPAHKTILKKLSPYFKEMIENLDQNDDHMDENERLHSFF